MKILTYKRTHTGDPDNSGIFGINDCMGTIRNRKFDAVVGVGSKSPWSGSEGITGKVTWIGVGPFRIKSPVRRGDMIAFEQFLLLDANGPEFEKIAPNLAKRFYDGGARSIINSYSKIEKEEVERLISDLISRNDTQCNSGKSVMDKLGKRREKCAERFFFRLCKS